MTWSAWVTMLTTWAIAIFFAARFVHLVLRTPTSGREQEAD